MLRFCTGALTPEGDWGCCGGAGAGLWSCQSNSVEPQDLSGAVFVYFLTMSVLLRGVLERGHVVHVYTRVFSNNRQKDVF